MPEFSYPPAVNTRSGCKVSWLYYKTKPEAEAAAKVAKRELQWMMSRGYDYGYVWPGSIYEVPADSQSEYAGLWEVCIP